MKKILILAFTLWSGSSFAQSFSLPGNNYWYKVATIGGHHGYIDYIYWHDTGYNPSLAKGEIQFINARNSTIQHHQTMGYGAWNQPTFALLNFSDWSELWVKATYGVAPGTFKINNSINVNLTLGNASDDNLSDNGGTLTIYDKLEDDKNTFVGDLKTISKANFGNYPGGAGSSNSYSLEVGGPSPTNNSGQATMFFHHHGVIANQLRYNGGNLYWEAASNGYGTTTTPNFLVAGNVGIGNTNPDAKLTVSGQVHAQEVKVTVTAPGPDYVFEKDYQLTSLEEIKNYIDQNKHLPEVPSAKAMEKNGVQLGEMNMLLLKKIEELTLYVIEQNKRTDDQNRRISALEAENKELKIFLEK